jgi:hypothetical protein
MGQGIANTPQNIKEGNYGQAAIDIGVPLATGAIGGLGTKNVGQFLNNTFNPLAGGKNLVNNLRNKSLMREYNAIEQNLNSSISEFKSLENKFNIKQKELWQDYKSGKITGEDYSKQMKSEQPWAPFESPIFPLEKQLRELSVKKDILNTPQKNILKNEQQLGKNISDGGTNNKGVFELNDNYVARLSAHGYDDASRLLNYNTRIKSPRIMKTQQVKELNGKVFQVQDKAIGKPYTQLSETELKNLPKEHIDNFYKDIAELEKNGLSIDISGGKSNIFYDSKKGFQFIDLGIGKMPNIDDINKVVNFKNPVGNFKSEINWEKWVKYKEDFHNNPEVIKHLNEIEKTTKTNGTWMKNPDGTPFKGTEEQFVVQQSDNFKKAFGNSKLVNPNGGFNKLYHGSKVENIKEFLSPKRNSKFKENSVTTKDNDYIYFSPDFKSAEWFIPKNKGKMYEVYANVRNPEITDNYRYLANPVNNSQKLNINDAITNIDFNTMKSSTGPSEIAIPFSNKVKSAVGNILLDMSNPNIYKTITAGALGTQYLKNQEETPEEFNNGGQVKKPKKKLIKAKK